MQDHGDRSRVEDTQLAERARRGDLEAYEELVKRYQALAQRTAYVITRDAASAEDASQEAFLKAYRALDRFRPGAPFRPWLLRIVANEAINRAQAASRHGRSDLTLAETVASGPETSPEARVLASEQREIVVRALNAMRDEDRLVIAYRYFFDLSEAEMSDALAIARGTVKSRLSRAMSRLREVLHD